MHRARKPTHRQRTCPCLYTNMLDSLCWDKQDLQVCRPEEDAGSLCLSDAITSILWSSHGLWGMLEPSQLNRLPANRRAHRGIQPFATTHTHVTHTYSHTHNPRDNLEFWNKRHSVVIVSKSFFFSCEITHYFGPCTNQIWYHPTCPVEDKLQSLSVLSGSWKYCFWLCELMMEPVIDFFNFSVTSINTDYVTGRRLTLKWLWWWTPTYFPGLSRSLMSSLRDSEYCFTIESSLFYLNSNLIFALLLMGL